MAAMEAGDEAEVGAASENFSATADQTLNLLIASSLGLGYLCFLLHGKPPKPLSTAIGAADGALKGAKLLGDLSSRPFPFSFLAASKALIKGYKASKRLNLIKGSHSLVPKKASAYLRLLNVVRYGRSFLLGDGLVGLGFLSSGYKLSKNVFKAVEDFTGNRFDSAIRNGVDAVGLSIKAATVVAELERIAAARLIRRKNCSCGCPRSRTSLSGSRYVLHSKLIRKATVDCEFASVKTFPVEKFVLGGRILIPEQSSSTIPSELLCLSIPLIISFFFCIVCGCWC